MALWHATCFDIGRTQYRLEGGFRTWEIRVRIGIRKKGQAKMSRLRKVLDPTKTGKDAESLERTLLKLVVGQEEAVEQIVNIYQMNFTGLSAPGRPVGN